MDRLFRGVGRLLAGCCALLLVGMAQAAEIDHVSLDDQIELIVIQGDIMPGDEETFRNLSVRYDNAIVALASDGGALVPALQIGQMIRLKGFRTAVIDQYECTSACALIWVAGATRFLSPTGRVGFHASYVDVEGINVETGVGNALVGRYLTLLDLPERAIIFATYAPPDHVLWLNSQNMGEAGIEFEIFGVTDENQSLTASNPSVTVLTRRFEESPRTVSSVSGWQEIDASDTTIRYLDLDSIFEIGGHRAVWALIDHSNDSSVEYDSIRYLSYYNCSVRQYALKAYLTFDVNGRVMDSHEWPDRDLDWNAVVPDSVSEAEHEATCG